MIGGLTMTKQRTIASRPAQRRRVIAPAEPVADLGPRVRLRRGEVAAEFAPDPDAPNRTIRRARVQWVPDLWLARGAIGRHHHDASCRYVAAYERGVLGGRERHAARISTNRPAPTGLPDAQLAAARDYALAERAVGIRLSAALAWCVLSTGTVEGWAECKGWHRDRASGYLLAALDRLAEHYGYVTGGEPRISRLTRRGD